ncbi:chromatin remodeling complex subunit [Colletotrichum sojae]|uniref:Chromatin remodeling complex subunit n=1 Tax=Colletotrichum sojae TaxID=2175907 RepID=A0A8H6JNS0_9PEZI|nr:chromatin remodeling complex subunit [Colletotrichum sojae]
MDSILNQSSSDQSCSPPASRASTRDTTPEFDPSPSAAANGPGSMRMYGMENSNLQQVGDHRLSGGVTPAMFRRFNQQHHHHQQQQQSLLHQPQPQHQQVPVRHVLPNFNAPRSLDAPNWRMGIGMGSGRGQGQGSYHTMNSTSAPESMMIGSPVTERHVAPDSHRDSMGVDTSGFYAYCLDRGNGNYTRLVPADCLPPLVGIPAVQHGADGMLVLPAPRGLDPQIPPGGTVQPVTFKKRIDHIIASSPATPKKPKIYCDKWVHEGVCAFTQQGCKYKHEMPLDKATQHSLGLFHGLPTWWKKQQVELQRQQQQQQQQDSEAFFDGRQAQQGALPSPIRSERGLPSPARTSQSWRRVESIKTHGPIGSVSSSRQNGGAYRSSTEPRSVHQSSIDSPTSPCVWGPIGPPSKQASEHSDLYHQSLGGFGSSNGFSMQSSNLGDGAGDGRAGSRFETI